MAIDWRDLTHEHRVTVQMVSQTNLYESWGTLEGVDLSASTLDAGYYTDTRTSGTLRVHGEGWVRGSFLRIIHEVPEFGYRNVLGTYIVTNDDAQRGVGDWSYDLELHSTLMGLSGDLLTRPWSIAKGASALDCAKQVLVASGMHSMRKTIGSFSGALDAKVELDDSLADDIKATTAQVMRAGTSRLECLYALAAMSRNRMDVAPNGHILFTKHVDPSAKTPKLRIDLSDRRGVVVAGSLSRHTNWLEMPDTVAVEHDYSADVETGETYQSSGTRSDGTSYNAGDPKTKSEQTTLYGIARVPASAHQAVANRGYSIVSFYSVQDMTPKTAKRANEVAAEYLNKGMHQLVEWELDCCYLPVWEGDVVELRVLDGHPSYRGTRKCLVKDVSINLGTMGMHLTLKETASGDWED